MKKIIQPQQLKGVVTPPPSKSMAHRLIICASLADGQSVIDNVAINDDITATIEAMQLLGAKIARDGSSLVVDGIGDNVCEKDLLIDCKESGSTLRFVLPIALAKSKAKLHFVGKGRLGKRPMLTYYEIFKTQKIDYQDDTDKNPQGLLDLTTQGTLSGGSFFVAGDVSSQFVSGLLFALPLAKADSVIYITSELESKSYVDLTISALNMFGVEIENKNYEKFVIKGNQKYSAGKVSVEGDFSQASFFVVANALGAQIDIQGLNDQSLQGDKEIFKLVDAVQNSPDEPLVIDGKNIPDIIPALSVACALRKGVTIVENISRLRLKECDRLNAIADELTKLGANVREYEKSLRFDGVECFIGNVVDSRNDHRIAMMLAIASNKCIGDIEIENSECISKSYPDFFDILTDLGGKIL
ncbi:MAG: 3-phosphoshikimate 1-carboxyvinyltransferase [Clostridia bacterium]